MEANNKLREALVCAIQALDIAARNTRGETGMVVGSCYSEAARKCRAALAAPIRNCDVGTAEELMERFLEYCGSHYNVIDLEGCRRCPLSKLRPNCEFAWVQMPYREGENDGSK